MRRVVPVYSELCVCVLVRCHPVNNLLHHQHTIRHGWIQAWITAVVVPPRQLAIGSSAVFHLGMVLCASHSLAVISESIPLAVAVIRLAMRLMCVI